MSGLRMRLSGDWGGAQRLMKTARMKLPQALDRAVAQEAHEARKQIVQGIRKQEPGGQKFEKLSKLTRALRKMRGFAGRKALIRTGALINSVTVKRAGKGRYFVGVLRGGKGTGGADIAHLAAVHERGATFVVRVTPKMRRFLMMLLRKAGILDKRRRKRDRGTESAMVKRVLVVRIPARPFMKPVLDKMGASPAAVRKRVGERVKKLLGYTLGK